MGKKMFIWFCLVLVFAGISLNCEKHKRSQVDILSQYPELKPVAEFVGGKENLCVLHLVGYRAAKIAMKELGFRKGDDVLCMTTAGFSVIDTGAGYPTEYYTTEKAIDGVTAATGCSYTNGNLLTIHGAMQKALWFAFIEDGGDYAGDCIYLAANKETLKTWLDEEKQTTNKDLLLRNFMALKDYEIFPATEDDAKLANVKANMDANYLLSNDGITYWGNLKGSYARFDSGGDEFSIMTISNIWAMDDPRAKQLLAASQLHDHICPGLTAGKYLADYLWKQLPLGKDEAYYIIGVPCYCKDDYFTYLMRTTAGTKSHMTGLLSSDDQQKLTAVGAGDAAGVFIRFNEATKTGKALVLTFDFNKVAADAGVNRSDFKDFSTYKWWWARLKSDIAMMQYLDTPERYVATYGTYDVDQNLLDRLRTSGVNPYVELGIITP